MTLVAVNAHAQSASLPASAAIQRGELLFSGQAPLTYGGPACIGCHSVGGLPFPNGGTLGPDLTQVAVRMGDEGIQSALKTLYFPAMVPLYKTRPLTPDEQQDMAAFLHHAEASAPPAVTPQVAVIGAAIFLLFVSIAWRAGRGRLRGVRRHLVETARAAAAVPKVAEGEPR